jgi:hypothetical protein
MLHQRRTGIDLSKRRGRSFRETHEGRAVPCAYAIGLSGNLPT